ncbi:MAG: hypothetical protein QG628_122 [Patescibacteria group bacterium]|nr:hypothetical protein [Patescibacteria group bacterium]
MAECLPRDFDFLNEYQRIVQDQIKWDEEKKGTIRGKNSVTYMYDGLVEELGEITEEDRVEPDYNRLGAIVSLGSSGQLQPGMTTPTATNRHIKEFGDVSWYLANYLSLFNIPFDRIIEPGIVAWRLDNISTPRSSEAFALQNEGQFPWLKFSVYKDLLPTAALGVTRQHEGILYKKQRDSRIRDEAALVIASGKFVLSMIQILAARFDTTYEDVLTRNNEKIEKRIREGTVFDKSGGDDR